MSKPPAQRGPKDIVRVLMHTPARMPPVFTALTDAITARAKPYERTLFFLPCSRAELQAGKKETSARVKRELYAKIYQSIGSLVLAIINVECIRRVRKATEIIEQGNRAYEDYRKQEYSSRDEGFEKAVETAKRIRAEIDAFIPKLVENPLDYETCKQIAGKVTEFQQQVIAEVTKTSWVSRRELLKTIPKYEFNADRAWFNGPDEIINAFAQGQMPGMMGDDVEGYRIRGRTADFYLNLQSSARTSQFFNPQVPKEIPRDVDPIALHIHGEESLGETMARTGIGGAVSRVLDGKGDASTDATAFAGLFEAMEKNLLRHFDAVEMERNGKKLVVFCPQPGLLTAPTMRLPQPASA